jgi:hypothetical protein
MAVPIPIRPTCPFFYRYSTPEHLDWLKSIVLHHQIYLPSLRELNDPADGRPKLAQMSVDRLSSFLLSSFVSRNPTLRLSELEKHAAIIQSGIEKFGSEWALGKISTALNAELEGYRIYSMSKRWDNLSMWAKYAANHTGYCLEFVNEGPFFVLAREVIYGDATEMDVADRTQRSGYWFFCKRQEWSNEEEVRTVLLRGSGSTVEIEPHWLARLILGKDMTRSNRAQILEWAAERVPPLPVVNANYDQLNQLLRLSS